jgi:hypothetical protein
MIENTVTDRTNYNRELKDHWNKQKSCKFCQYSEQDIYMKSAGHKHQAQRYTLSRGVTPFGDMCFDVCDGKVQIVVEVVPVKNVHGMAALIGALRSNPSEGETGKAGDIRGSLTKQKVRIPTISPDNDKRVRPRIRQEIVVGVRTEKGINMAYTFDISTGGVKLGSPQLFLPLGGQVEIVVDRQGEKHLFSGCVLRADGSHYINRISRSANAFFVRIDDEQYSKFMNDHFFV